MRWGIEQIREMGDRGRNQKRGREKARKRRWGETGERGESRGGDRGESVRVKEEEGG